MAAEPEEPTPLILKPTIGHDSEGISPSPNIHHNIILLPPS